MAVGTVEEALEAYKSFPPSVVIADLGLPGANGLLSENFPSDLPEDAGLAQRPALCASHCQTVRSRYFNVNVRIEPPAATSIYCFPCNA